MNHHDKTKDELIKELQELKQERDLLKTSYLKNISEFKQATEVISMQKDALLKFNNFSIGLSKLTLEDNLEAFIARNLKEITGARVAIFSEYNQANRTITAKHIEIEPGLLEKVVSLLGQQVDKIHSELTDEMYNKISSEVIGVRKTLYEVTFGAISRPVGAAIKALLKIDRFIGLAYLVKGKLYGTSLLTMSMDQPDPPREILENFLSLAALSLQRHLTEKLLKESTERLNDAQKLAHIGVWDWKPDTDTVTWTDELYHIAGLDLTLPAPTYKEHSNLYTPESWKLLKTSVEKAMETGEPYQLELELIRPNGDTRYVNTFGGAKFNSSGQVDGLFGTVQDITERKQAEDALRVSEARFRSLFENSLTGISIASPDGRLLRINLAYARMYGYENTETMLAEVDNVRSLYSNPEDRKEVLRILSKNGFMEAKEIEVCRRDGSRLFVLISACEIRDDEGNLLYNQAIHMDLSDQKKSEKELRKSKELLEELNQHLQDVRENERALISREIHDELGQSMTAIKLDLNRMYKYVNDNPDAVTQLNSMIKLVSDTIKDVQRISSDLRPGILDDLGLVYAIEWYCDEFEKRTGIKCFQKLENSDYSNSKITLTFFRTLQESLTNVIRHAKASSVNVKLHLTQKGTILTIKDNGIGIPEEKIESHKSLGLISMRERVRQLNGRIDISSKKGGGTKLTVFIPSE